MDDCSHEGGGWESLNGRWVRTDQDAIGRGIEDIAYAFGDLGHFEARTW